MVDEITVPISERSTPMVLWKSGIGQRRTGSDWILSPLKTPFYAFGRHAELTWLIPGSGLAPSLARAQNVAVLCPGTAMVATTGKLRVCTACQTVSPSKATTKSAF